MVMPAPTPVHRPKRWTIDQLYALPDDGTRREIIDGELFVTPAPSLVHQNAVMELYVLLRAHLLEHPVGRVFVAPADVEVSEDTVVEPDLFVIPRVPPPWPRAWRWDRGMLLAVEVLSPGTARADRQAKRRLYQRRGLPEYWIVDLDARLVERWTPADDRPEVLVEELRWHPEGAGTPLVVQLPAYFERAWGND
jgi:Uma2 family endonuclease